MQKSRARESFAEQLSHTVQPKEVLKFDGTILNTHEISTLVNEVSESFVNLDEIMDEYARLILLRNMNLGF